MWEFRNKIVKGQFIQYGPRAIYVTGKLVD